MAAMAAAVIVAVERPVTETGEGGVVVVAIVVAATGGGVDVDVDVDAAAAVVDDVVEEEDVVASTCPLG